MTGHPQRFFFVHVQKTAGTTLNKRMQRHFGRSAIYPDRNIDGEIVASVISVEHLLSRWQARGEEIKVVTGHFPLCTAELLGGEFTTLTLLREPIERTLSYLRHHRLMTEEDREKSLQEIYSDTFRFHGLVHNHMVKMFSLTPSEMTDGVLTRVEFSRDRLERAKERLATVDVVGLQEGFEDFCQELTGRFGWRLGGPVHSNRTDATEASEAFRSRIAEDNVMDIQLYDFARQLCEQRRARATVEA
jgi:Sulfotransferase family